MFLVNKLNLNSTFKDVKAKFEEIDKNKDGKLSTKVEFVCFGFFEQIMELVKLISDNIIQYICGTVNECIIFSGVYRLLFGRTSG